MRSRKEGDSTVPGQIALQRTPWVMKSAATDLVKPITAALVAPYTKRFGAPLMLPATDATLMIEPLPFFNMPGKKALIIRNCERTLSENANSHSSSVQSNTDPACTKPAPLNSTSTGPCLAAAACTASALVTSSTSTVQPHSLCSDSSAAAFTSVAMTRAPCATNAKAVARPMPCPAAVTNAVFPVKRLLMVVFLGCNYFLGTNSMPLMRSCASTIDDTYFLPKPKALAMLSDWWTASPIMVGTDIPSAKWV